MCFCMPQFFEGPPFAKIDLVSCRNVLIYLEPFLQKKAFSTFHYALNEKKYLLLGKSETTNSSPDLFLPLGKKEKLFIKKPLPGRYRNVGSERREEVIKDNDYGISSNERKKDDVQKNADEIVLSRYAPAGVIVNDQFEIVQFRGSTGDFLEPSPGKATFNVLKMAREGLSFELRNALHRSKTSNSSYSKEGIPIHNGKKLVAIEIIPLPNVLDPHFLILFKETNKQSPSIGDQQMVSGSNQEESTIRIQQLENDLLQAREDMRDISENQEAANEELQSANEELLSGSEELQSLNEELETSKEELQSTNEELITVNQELFDRNEQLDKAKIYAETIVSTIHEPLIILSQDFRIVSANRSFYKIFSIIEDEAIGRILFEMQDNHWDLPGLRSHLLRIQSGKENFLDWEITHTFPNIGNRTICFSAQPIPKANGENWIMLAFNDITVWKEKESIEKRIAKDLKIILEALPQITIAATPDGAPTYFNRFFLTYAGMDFAEALETGWEHIIKPKMRDEFKNSWANSITTGKNFNMEVQLKRKSDDMYRWHLWRTSVIRNEEDAITSWVSAAMDIHEQKTKEDAKDEFISIASHELKTPLTTAKAYIQLLQSSLTQNKNSELLYAQKANQAIDRLGSLIAELLDVSKIQNGHLPLNITMFDFDETISSAIEDVQRASPGYTIIKTGELKKEIKGDSQRIQQVMINLLSNAVKYSPKSDRVFVSISQENQVVKVSVRDTGIGIRKENLEKIFERYYREDGRDFNFQGLGIGLSISYNIIQRHNGKIWAESEQDKGSTFYFTLPI